MRFIVLPEAQADLASIRESRAAFSEQAAENLAFALLRRMSRIQEFPRAGRRIPEFQVEYLREVLEQGYRIMYEVFVDRVEVFGIVSSRQDIRPPR